MPPAVKIQNLKPIAKQGNKMRKKPETLAEQIDAGIQNTIATKFAPITANILATQASELGIQSDEFLAFVERNLNDYNRIVLEALRDKL
jgi:hypothetical protein